MPVRKSLAAFLYLTLALLSLGPLTGAEPVSLATPEVTSALNTFSAEALWEHIEFLASDELEGREAGKPGYDLAAEYMASQFQALGLAHGGDQGSYYQQVTFRGARVKDASMTLRTGDARKSLKQFEDFLAHSDHGRTESEITAGVVFVGYGVSAPGMGYDDYAGVDVEGKIVALISGAPGGLPSDHRAHLGSTATKKATASGHGAAGIVFLRGPGAKPPWNFLAGFFSRREPLTWLGPGGEPGRYFPGLQAAAILNRNISRALFKGAEHSLKEAINTMKDSGAPLSFPLDAEMSISVHSQHSSFDSPNVAAVLPGSDPALKNEYVVFSAHLDHVGIAARGKDRIRNGAYDNATGSGTLLEIAKAFASLPRAPRRSVVFLALTAEEKGLLGSDYFANHPTTGGRIVANINMDMHLMLYPLKGVAALGAEHSSLEGVMRRALEHVGLEMVPDPVPQFRLFTRSDHYSFVKQGIPATFLVSGLESADPKIDGKEVFDNWFRTTYHQPNDDTSQEMHLESGVKMAQANFLAGYLVANQDEAPRWNKGDFFGDTFGHSNATGNWHK